MFKRFTITDGGRTWTAKRLGTKNGKLHILLRDRRKLARGHKVRVCTDIDPGGQEWIVSVTSGDQLLLVPAEPG